MSATPDASKKKSRRRLRVSCVECTRRRQKCDREQPCGLCKARGVSHLCRWELEPFARPPPARPPVGSRSKAGQAAQSAQSAPSALADSLLQPIPSLTSSTLGISSVDQEVKEAAIALAQLSVARQGEYLGTGSIVCALHKLDGAVTTRVPFDKSSGMPVSMGEEYSTAISSSFAASFQALIYGLPAKHSCDALITGFFDDENWRFGYPRTIILPMYDQMWDAIHTNVASLNRIKVHWLTLLFSIFALSPTCVSEDESRKYFLQALTGRRLSEDLFAASFTASRTTSSVTEGTAQACLAAVLLSHYMCDRGQASEAWKIIGSAVRHAQNAGLHVGPTWTKWKDMPHNEQVMRKAAWLSLATQDQFLSFLLGRPSMIHRKDYDVPLPKIPDSLASDGSSDTALIHLACLNLLIDIMDEAKTKFLSPHPEPQSGSTEVDAQLENWRMSLPPYFSCTQTDMSYDHIYPALALQRCNIGIIYYACCMIFYRSMPHAQSTSLHISQVSAGSYNTDYNKLASFAINLLHAQRLVKSVAHQWKHRQPYFANTYLVFEAAVTLCIALHRDPNNPYAEEWRDESKEAIKMLESERENDSGDIVRQAILVLQVLQDCKLAGADSFKSVEFPIPAAGPSSTDISVPLWTQSLDPVFPTATSTHSSDSFQSIQAPLDWMADSINGTVTAFDLLHSLDK